MIFIPLKDDLIYIKTSGADASLRILAIKVVGSIPYIVFLFLSLINALNRYIP